MTQAGAIQTLNIGDTIPVGTVLANLIILGMITDVNNPNMFAATLQAFQSNAVLTVPMLQGRKGDPGQPTFALRFQNNILTSPSQLPTTLNDTPADLGKYWVFGVTDQNGQVVAAVAYVWYGTTLHWKQFPIGSPGAPGAYPLITPHIVLMEPDNGQGPNGADSWVAVTGTASNPSFTFHIAAPQGIAGPTATLELSADVDFNTREPLPGDILTCSSRLTPGSPTGLGILGSSSGGSFAAGSYFWAVTAVQANGSETMPSNEVVATFTGSSSSALLSWVPPPGSGAVAQRIYRGTSVTELSSLIAEIGDGTTSTFTDTGTSGTPGQPPSDSVVAGRRIWVPADNAPVLPKLYTVPSSAFSSLQGVGGTSTPVCTFPVPPQPWAWKPFVFGQMQIFGLNISFSPLLVGAEVLLGSPTAGQLVSAGIGNSLGAVNLIPQASSAANPSQAMTPTNRFALVPRNHVGTAGTLYLSLVQQGMAGTFDFNSHNAQLVVMVIPHPNLG